MENLKNIVILRDLPSNMIEEAFVVLKNNQKSKKLEHIDGYNGFESVKSGIVDNDVVIKEAELLINNYLEDDNKSGKTFTDHSLSKKYKRLKRIAAILVCSLFVSIVYILL